MSGLTKDLIKQVRSEMTEFVKDILESNYEIIPSYFQAKDIFDLPVKNHSLRLMAKSLEMLSDADMIIMGKGWEYSRGCIIEHQCAREYLDIPIIYMS